MFNVVNSSIMNNFTTVQELSRTREILKDNKMFFKDRGHNQLCKQIQGKFLAHKDDWQPWVALKFYGVKRLKQRHDMRELRQK